MREIDVFYQGEGVREIEHIELGPDHTFASLKAILVEKHGLETDILIFLEDSDEPVNELLLLREHVGHAGVKIHVHRCRSAVSYTHLDVYKRQVKRKCSFEEAVRTSGLTEEQQQYLLGL